MSKICRLCGVTKSETFFRKYSRAKDGLQSYCIECAKKKDAAYRKENPEKIKAIYDKWNASNPGKQKEKSRSWYLANCGLAKKKSAEWYENNKERAKQSHAAYRLVNREKWTDSIKKSKKLNPEKYANIRRISSQNRRAMIRAAGGKLSLGLPEKLMILQKGKCACGCKQPLGDDYHLDHITPLALGGTNADYNIQLLRASCNLQKHAKHPIDFMQQRGFLL